MSVAASENVIAEKTSQMNSSTHSSVAQLVRRVSAEIDAAEQRVHSLRVQAAQEFVGREQQLTRFVGVADRIHAILLPRLEALANASIFNDIKQSVSLERQGQDGRDFHGRTTKITVPYSDKRPAPMEFTFHVGHDGPLKNAVLDFRLQVLPLFIEFADHDQLVIPLDQPSETAVAAWIDDKLVGFTRIYFEVFFSSEYQKNSLETDPVMQIQFPKAFAIGKAEHERRTYYFYTQESLEKFDSEPSKYVTTR